MDFVVGVMVFVCGVKIYNGVIGLIVDLVVCEMILEELQGQGYVIGLVVIVIIVYVILVVFVVYQFIWVFYEEIVEDFVVFGVDYLVGGGKCYFDWCEKDEWDFIWEMEGNSYYVISYLEYELKDFVFSLMSCFCYFVVDKYLFMKVVGWDYFLRVVFMGVSFLGWCSNIGFFLMVEGFMIDWGGYFNDGGLVIEEIKDFDWVVKEVLNFVRWDREMFVIVMVDYEFGGMVFNLGFFFELINVSFIINGYIVVMVFVFVYGLGVEFFDGIYENMEIYYKMRQVLGLL